MFYQEPNLRGFSLTGVNKTKYSNLRMLFKVHLIDRGLLKECVTISRAQTVCLLFNVLKIKKMLLQYAISNLIEQKYKLSINIINCTDLLKEVIFRTN